MEANLVSHIPRSERELERVEEGELVTISILDVLIRSHVRAIFIGNKGGLDTFIAQELKLHEGADHLVAIYSEPRVVHKYDGCFGVLLSIFYSKLNFVRPGEKKYAAMVEQLKQANLWRDN